MRAASCPSSGQEITTEGGLDVAGQIDTLAPFVAKLRRAGIQVSLFIDPEPEQIEASAKVGTDAIEFHTGTYCRAANEGDRRASERELKRLADGARQAAALGLEVHAGHGLDYDNVGPVASIPEIVELNIGHHLVGEAIFVGLAESVARMRAVMDGARARLRHSDTEASLGGVMIIGLGNDVIDIRRVERTIERYGERFLARIFTDTERAQVRQPRGPRRLLRQALRRQGGLRQGARHRLPARRVLARHGRREFAFRPSHTGADRRRGEGACTHHP